MSDDAVFIPPVAAIPSRKSVTLEPPANETPNMPFDPLVGGEPRRRKPRIKRMKAKIARVPSTPPKQRKPRRARHIAGAAGGPDIGLTAFKVLLAFMNLDPKTRKIVIELAKSLP
jgi:hypothetical protein